MPEHCDNRCESIPLDPRRKRERLVTDAGFIPLRQVLDELSGNGTQVSAGAANWTSGPAVPAAHPPWGH